MVYLKFTKVTKFEMHVINFILIMCKLKNVINLKFRPIVAGPACQSQRLGNLIDI